MGSVVTHDVPSYEVWAGNPAHKIKDRFDEETKRAVEESRCWEKSDAGLEKMACDFDDAAKFAEKVK